MSADVFSRVAVAAATSGMVWLGAVVDTWAQVMWPDGAGNA